MTHPFEIGDEVIVYEGRFGSFTGKVDSYPRGMYANSGYCWVAPCDASDEHVTMSNYDSMELLSIFIARCDATRVIDDITSSLKDVTDRFANFSLLWFQDSELAPALSEILELKDQILILRNDLDAAVSRSKEIPPPPRNLR